MAVQRGRPAAKRADMVTIADVARHAGVAVSTVSYVLSGKRAISATTRQRVLASIRALGYHPHAGARALASQPVQRDRAGAAAARRACTCRC